jgi:phospholipid-binding lipoprotein MlaA
MLIGVAILAATAALAPAQALSAPVSGSTEMAVAGRYDSVSHGPATPGARPYDPLESMNRKLFGFNKGLDRAIIRPVAIGYKRALPRPVRTGVRNVLNNLGEPVTFINDVLQIRFDRANTAVGRFLLNTTVGVGGLFDVAGAEGVPIHYSDFGQTLGHYGAPPGPYIYVPVLGPSDLRDGTGRIADGFISPLNLHDLHVSVGERIGVVALDGIDTRAEYDNALKELARTATDEYAAQRSIYLQNRQSMITEPNAAIQQLPDFDTPAAAPAQLKP